MPAAINPIVNKKKFDASELQSNILTAFQRERSLLTIFMMNGPQINGRVKRFDTFTVTISSDDGNYYLLYKHGIAGYAVKAGIFKNMKFEEKPDSAQLQSPELAEQVA